jgi:hypothetical protein
VFGKNNLKEIDRHVIKTKPPGTSVPGGKKPKIN